MADPDEGVAADGTIRTGARRDRVPAMYEPVLTDAVALAGKSAAGKSAAGKSAAAKSAPASLYVYGSVANGTARPGSSDVDLLSIGLPDASILGQRLSARYAGICRGVEVAAATAADLAGDTDAAYGYRVFLRHYCVHLAGPDPSIALAAFPADARAARGFNGDLGQYLRRWRRGLESGAVAADLLGVRIARKTLLAVAGLVSVHDHTWTTDRSRAVQRWSELEPGLAAELSRLHSWGSGERHSAREEAKRALADDGIIAAIVERFDRSIGLWADDPEAQ